MSFYDFRLAQGASCWACGSQPVEFHHIALRKLSRRGHPLKDFTTISLCRRHHTGPVGTGMQHTKQAAWATEFLGGEEILLERMLLELAAYTLSLEEQNGK